jgi:hypothetical protein
MLDDPDVPVEHVRRSMSESVSQTAGMPALTIVVIFFIGLSYRRNQYGCAITTCDARRYASIQ